MLGMADERKGLGAKVVVCFERKIPCGDDKIGKGPILGKASCCALPIFAAQNRTTCIASLIISLVLLVILLLYG
jgi:hypothetical protein